jgi:energy-coupling factor transporter ATP-binding protein EcfA2
MWLQQEEFRNPDLLCVEIPKPLEQLPQGLRKLLRGGKDCLPEWRRERLIAYVMSSDCYRLCKDDSEPGNHIGFRHTWIKMSRPSIESLRQAFLDRGSRIRFGPVCPDEQYAYPKIRRVAVQGGPFLRRMEEIHWSSNLNCLIGSRGTGKSTLLDYMRVALDRLREGDLPPSLREEVEDRVRDSPGSIAHVEVDLETRGGSYRVVHTGEGGGKRQVFPVGATEPDPQLDVRTLFPCRILSQREIDHSVDRRDRAALRKFLDDFIRRELSELEREEQNLKGKINQIEAALAAKWENQKRRTTIETERRDLESQLESQKRLSELLPHWQGIETERDFFERLFKECEEIVILWRERLEDLELKSALLTEELRNTPNAGLIVQAAQTADAAVQKLRESVETAINSFWEATSASDSPLRILHQERWKPLFEESRQRFEAAQKEAKGVSVQTITEIPKRLLTLKAELSALDRERVEIEQLEGERQTALAALRQVWRRQTETRQRKAEELMERLRPRPDGKAYVEIRVEHQADRDEIVKVLAAKIPDRRRLNEDDIKGLIDHLVSELPADSHLTLMERFIAESRGGAQSGILREVFQDRRREAFLNAFTEPVLRQLETERIPDYVMYYVYRQDGTLAGPIDKVSAGQQGTAILNLLLAAGDEPLVVDTPEEGLDNEGVYAELVPLFRREKEKRQIIIVTHNANLPVNADAEGIVALEAAGFVPDNVLDDIVQNSGQHLNHDQRQHLAALIRWSNWETQVRHYLRDSLYWSEETVEQALRQIGNARQAEGRVKAMVESDGARTVAVGALDAPAVKRAVQDIMEGSEEAFRRRREKYGF